MMGGGHTTSHDEPATDGSGADPADSFDEFLEAAVSPLHASQLADADTRRFVRLAIGTRVSERFVVEWYAGAGGMGDVYRCLDNDTNCTVALKVIRQLHYEARFRREVSILSALSHEAIVRYIAHGTTETGTPYLAMEWLEGEDLGRRLKRNRLSVSDSITLARRVCSALALAHAHGFTHRDIKPSNVFLCEGKVEQAKLLDFGVAHRGVATQTATRAGTLLGTVGYMAPEQASGMRVPDARDDLFSLGCVLFECLTGRPAFNGESSVAVLESVLHGHPPNVQTLQPDVPAELASLVRDLLHKQRRDRPSDVSVVVKTLDAIEAQRDSEGPSAQLVTSSVWHVEPVRLRAQVAVWHQAGDLDTTTLDQLERIAHSHRARRTEPAACRDASAAFTIDADGELTLVDVARRALELGLELIEAVPALTVASSCLANTVQKPELARAGLFYLDGASAALVRTHAAFERSGLPALVVTPDPAIAHPVLPFVGRETELATLGAVFAECDDDRVARTVLVSAPPGCGKSRLAAEFMARVASTSSARTVEVTARHVEASVPFSLVHSLHRALSELLDASTRLAHQAVFTAGDQRALITRLAEASACSPLVVYVEDAHWADTPSMQLLACCLHELGESPVFVLGAARSDLHNELKEMWRAMGAHELLLRPLRGRAAERLLRTAAPERATDDAWLGRALGLGDGNPRLLRALLREPLRDNDPASPARSDAPSEVTAAWVALLQEQLAALPRAELNVLGAASVLGEGAAFSSVIAAIVEGSAGLDRELSSLCERKLLLHEPHALLASEAAYTFGHPLVRQAAYDMLTASQRAGAAERAATCCAQRGFAVSLWPAQPHVSCP